MLDPPADAWYVWLGLAAVSVSIAGMAISLQTAAPPQATPVADEIDSVAASPHEARTTVDVSADQLRLRQESVALRSDGGTAHAQVTFGPITPVSDGKLGRVLGGAHPSTVFDTKAEFESAIHRAHNRTGGWEEAPDQLVVARVTWRDVDATLVG